jgi:hypothetical protein
MERGIRNIGVEIFARMERHVVGRWLWFERNRVKRDWLQALANFHSSADLSNKIKELFLMIDANGRYAAPPALDQVLK